MPTLFKRSNGIYYLVLETDLGKRRWVSTGQSIKAKALARLSQLENSSEKTSRGERLEKFKEEFLSYAKTIYASGNVEIYEKSLRALLRLVGNVPITSINARDVDLFKANRLKEIAPITVNIELRTLRAAFYVALRWELIKANPFKCVQLCPIPQQTPRFITLKDFLTLSSSFKDEWMRNLVIVTALTGMRRGEAINLRWQEVDLAKKIISVQSQGTFRTKSGKRRSIPMNSTVFQVLSAMRKHSSGEYVFTADGQKLADRRVTHLFKRYVQRLKLNPTFHFHCLRHSFATWLVQDGVSIYEIQKLLGHSNIKTTEIYSYLGTENLHGTVERIAIKFD